MKTSETLNSMMNLQVKKEFESAYLYLGFAAFFEKLGLSGFSKWYRIQAKEEESHGLKFYEYLCESNQKLELFPIEAPNVKPESTGHVLKASLKHEEYITELITKMYFQAEKENDLFSRSFLNWFIIEQLEEEKNARCLIDRYEAFGSTKEGLYLIDMELGKRKDD